jgi:hypothetical protein
MTTPLVRRFRFGVVAAQAPTRSAWTDLLGVSSVLVAAELVDAFAPPVARLTGQRPGPVTTFPTT